MFAYNSLILDVLPSGLMSYNEISNVVYFFQKINIGKVQFLYLKVCKITLFSA